ncbi:MAG: amidohydrolase family protein [Burkholderiales bacterium]
MLKYFLIAALISSPAVAGELPLFDAHLHYSANAWEEFPPQAVIELLDRAGVKKALLSSTPIEGTLKLYNHAPDRFIPELRVYRKTKSLDTWPAERAMWFKDPELIPFLERELQRGIYRGIGEFHVNGHEVDTPVMRKLVDLAVSHNLHLHAHSDAEAIALLFSFNAKARIIWAHAGMSTPPKVIGEFMARYPALWADLSYRDVTTGDSIDPEWKELLLKFPDRFLYGSDTWMPFRWPQVPALAQEARHWLNQLPPDIAQRIAYKNAEKLF